LGAGRTARDALGGVGEGCGHSWCGTFGARGARAQCRHSRSTAGRTRRRDSAHDHIHKRDLAENGKVRNDVPARHAPPRSPSPARAAFRVNSEESVAPWPASVSLCVWSRPPPRATLADARSRFVRPTPAARDWIPTRPTPRSFHPPECSPSPTSTSKARTHLRPNPRCAPGSTADDGIRACYERQLRTRPDLAGDVKIRFEVCSIAGAGRVRSATGTGLGQASGCMAMVIRGIVFTSPATCALR